MVIIRLCAVDTERRLLHEEKQAFEVFRTEVLRDLDVQCAQLQVVEVSKGLQAKNMYQHILIAQLLCDSTINDVQCQQEELKLQQQQTSEHSNLSSVAQHTCYEVLL